MTALWPALGRLRPVVAARGGARAEMARAGAEEVTARAVLCERRGAAMDAAFLAIKEAT